MQKSQLYTSAKLMSGCPSGIWAFTQGITLAINSHDYLITSGFEAFSPIVSESFRKSCEILSRYEGIQRETGAEPTLEGIVRFF